MNSKLTSNDCKTQYIAKLRRLKIQESFLFSAIIKINVSLEQENINVQKNWDWKNFESSLKMAFIEIRNLLEDIKIAINSQKNIVHFDLIEIKKDVFDLEEKLKSYKEHLQTELIALRNLAKEIEIMFNTNQFVEDRVRSKRNKIQAKQFSEIIPSPVRAIIISPFKCPEVQKFQEFLSNHKRYGKWNEYNHNIFVQIWNKYFCNDDESLKLDDFVENTERFHLFREEVMEAIPGTTLDGINSHFKWYREYVCLKNCQQKALEKWKENKQKIEKPIQEARQNLQSHMSSFCKMSTRSSEKLLYTNRSRNESSVVSKIYNSTEQWKNRCNGNNDPPQIFPIIQDKRQVHIPTWRLGLFKN